MRKGTKQIEVVAAIIHDSEGRIFATQRGYGEWKAWWEFPGGKMEAGKTQEEALKRELWEELETFSVFARSVIPQPGRRRRRCPVHCLRVDGWP
ncbi:MAG: NUDIX domain-containing protein [Bacteroidaceae bacterium]|nr:NUDIX domain-containing protein [Bacteroidaceae bacterium]